ncbi:MAG TPA: hypothetical protein VHA78_00580 [Candidatus Peribacteraceae bacterium]|nr:hypothetical protein [Candidatus Peribacteraceae bacterium]
MALEESQEAAERLLLYLSVAENDAYRPEDGPYARILGDRLLLMKNEILARCTEILGEKRVQDIRGKAAA